MSMPVFMVQDYCNSTARLDADTLENATESEFSQQPLGTIHVAEEVPSEDYKPFITENDILKLHHEEKLKGGSPYYDNFDRTYGNFINESMAFHFEDTTEPNFVDHDFDSYISKSGWNLFSFSEDYQLQKALGTDVEDTTYQHTYGTSISNQNEACGTIGDREPSYVTDISCLESVLFPINEIEVEHALEANVSNTISSFDDNSSKSNVTSLSMPLEKLAASSKKHDRSKLSASVGEDEVPWNFLASEFIEECRIEILNYLSQESDEKTIKTAEISNKHENGTSWAVELGSKQQLCPIVVKDLDHPGHMLIEVFIKYRSKKIIVILAN
ncbi:hypothetical protein MIMGU_mgv1a009911mg [Erythranthe guttata]|uniref:Uncharacterized protein n=1 Tax=Erythranthe guttata TaxID=4155 RepID=A0A022RNW3_ERYGU|nr:hypothetical protein MIMGU_mgv1a009911mg [Erythranthe guttata]